MIESIRCLNSVTNAAVFLDHSFSPFMLKSVSGVSGFENSLGTSDNTMIDGAQYLGSVQQKRNIVITGKMLGDEDGNREALFRCFNTGDPGRIVITTSSGEQRMAEYYPESVDADGGGIPAKEFQISLICVDPYFYDAAEHSVDLAEWQSNFVFEHNFTADGEALGSRSEVRLASIYNASWLETGLTITLDAIGKVVNPKLTSVTTNEVIALGSEEYPLVLDTGDRVVITTGENNKHCYLVRNEVRTEINQYFAEGSVFFPLHSGNNTIGYEADSGDSNLIVDISYRNRYRGI